MCAPPTLPACPPTPLALSARRCGTPAHLDPARHPPIDRDVPPCAHHRTRQQDVRLLLQRLRLRPASPLRVRHHTHTHTSPTAPLQPAMPHAQRLPRPPGVAVCTAAVYCKSPVRSRPPAKRRSRLAPAATAVASLGGALVEPSRSRSQKPKGRRLPNDERCGHCRGSAAARKPDSLSRYTCCPQRRTRPRVCRPENDGTMHQPVAGPSSK